MSSFIQHYDIIKHALDVYKPDLVTFQETRITSKTKIPKFSQYHIYHSYENAQLKSKRGLAIMVHTDLMHKIIDNIHTSKSYDIMGVSIQDKHNRAHTIYNVYTACGAYFTNTDIFMNANCIIMGDFNARHRMWCRKTNKQGKRLLAYIEELDYVILNDGAATTRFNTTLDLIITNKNNSPNVSTSNFDLWFNDHFGQIVVIHDKRITQPYIDEMAWRTNKANWQEYSCLLEDLMAPLLDPSNDIPPEDMLDNIINKIELAAEKAVPRTCTKRNNPRKWKIDEATSQWHYQISKATKAFKDFPTQENLEQLRQLQKDSREDLRANKYRAIDQWAQSLASKNTKQLWKEVNCLKGKQHIPKYAQPVDKANELVQEFTTRGNFDKLPIDVQDDLKDREQDRLRALERNIRYNDNTDQAITLLEVNQALALNKNTAPGLDTLGYVFFKHTKELTRLVFTKFFNVIYTASVWPEQWATAIIVPIPKPSGEGLRPISLLNCFSKIFEYIIQKRLIYKLPNIEQHFGFTEGRGTVDAVVQLIDLITQGKRQNSSRHSIAIFFDLSKAFERARRLPVIEALIHQGIKGKLLAIIDAWITGRKARVKLQGALSESAAFECGVPQGSVLSPTIFNALVTHLISPATDDNNIHILAYADDIAAVCYANNPYNHIQNCIDKLQQSANSLGLVFAPNKTAAMAFYARQPAQILYLDKEPITYVTNYKYLGVIIDKRLTFIPYAKYIADKISMRLNILRILGGITRANTCLLRKLYIALIQPIIDYGAPALIGAKTSAINILEVAERRAIRLVLGLPMWTKVELVYAEANLLPFRFKLPLLTSKYIANTQIKSHPNPSATHVYNNPEDPKVSKPNTWRLQAGFIFHQLEMPILLRPQNYIWPPWQDKPFLVNIPVGPSKSKEPEEIASIAIHNLHTLSHNRKVFYTDASLKNDGRTGWAVVLPNNTCINGRVNNHLPITLLELHAVYQALNWAQRRGIYNILIATDSKSAIECLKNIQKPTYPETIKQIWKLCNEIHSKGIRPLFLWIPSHMDIEGNELADRYANQATEYDNFLSMEIPKATIKQYVDEFYFRRWYDHVTFISQYNKKLEWFIKSTGFPNKHICTNREIPRKIDVLLRRIRCSVYELKRIVNKLWVCTECEENNFSYMHYVVECPANHTVRNNLLQLLSNQEIGYSSQDRFLSILYHSYHNDYQPIETLFKTSPLYLSNDYPFDTG